MDQKVTPDNNTSAKTQKTKPSQRKKSFTAFALTLSALVLAIAVILNLLASRLDITWDMTPAKMYELSDTTTEYLDKLEEDGIVVDFYFLMDMDFLATSGYDMTLHHVLQSYSEYDCINFVDFDPDSNPAMLSDLNPDGVFNLGIGDIVIRYGDNTKHIIGNNMGMDEVSTNDAGEQVLEASYFTGENYITGAIDAVVSNRTSKVYFLTGHGEKTLSNDYTTFHANLRNLNYGAEQLDLTTVSAVPEDAAMIVVAGPQTDISNDEARKLNEYLDTGGNVSFLMSPNEENVVYKNIEAIMADFGIGMDYDIVRESDPNNYLNNDPQTFHVALVASDAESSDALTSGVMKMTEEEGYVAFMKDTRSFYQLQGYSDGTLEVGSLMQTISTTDSSGNTVSSAVGRVHGGDDPGAEDIEGQVLDLAMYARSPARNDAKILAFGNADFIDDTGVTEDEMMIPVYLYLSTITWMYNSDLDMDMGIADKAKGYDSMNLNSETEANTLSVIFIAVPFVVALIGAGVWLGRRNS